MFGNTEYPSGDEKALVRAIRRSVDATAPLRNAQLAKVRLVEAYLAGARKFDSIDYETGELGPYDYADDENPLAWALNLTVGKCATECARLAGQDLSPSVTQKMNSLQGLKYASSAQAVLDYLCGRDRMGPAQMSTRRGIMQQAIGLRPVFGERPDGTITLEADVIRGEELCSIPAGRPIAECDAVVRVRKVTLSWLRRQPDLSVPEGDAGAQRMQAERVPYGDVAEPKASGMPLGGSQKNDDSSFHVELCELFEKGPECTLARYMAIAGEALLADIKYDDDWCAKSGAKHPPCFPVWAANHTATDFHGRSKAELLIPTERMAEEAYASLARIAREFDQYGILLFPGSMGAAIEEMLKDIGNRGPKLGTYDHQPGADRGGIVSVSPANAGSMPGQVGGVFHNLLNEQAGQSPMLQGIGPSRVGAPGLATLFQASNIPLDAPAGSLAEMWSQFYRAVLYEVKLRFRPGDMVRLSVVDDSICGLKINPETLEATIDVGALPWPDEVEIGTRGRNMTDKENELQQAVMLRNAQMITDMEFWVWNFRKRLGIEGPKKRIQNAVEQAQLQHILLFGDGLNPGKGGALPAHEKDDVEVYVHMLHEFRTGPAFKFAGQPVKLAFAQYEEVLEGLRGRRLPSAIPNIEGAAQIDEDVAARMQSYMSGRGPQQQ